MSSFAFPSNKGWTGKSTGKDCCDSCRLKLRMFKKKLRELCSFSLEERRLRGILYARLQGLKGVKTRTRLHSEIHNKRRRGKRHSLHKGNFWTQEGNEDFTVRFSQHWDTLSKGAEEPPVSEHLTVCLDKLRAACFHFEAETKTGCWTRDLQWFSPDSVFSWFSAWLLIEGRGQAAYRKQHLFLLW